MGVVCAGATGAHSTRANAATMAYKRAFMILSLARADDTCAGRRGYRWPLAIPLPGGPWRLMTGRLPGPGCSTHSFSRPGSNNGELPRWRCTRQVPGATTVFTPGLGGALMRTGLGFFVSTFITLAAFACPRASLAGGCLPCATAATG